MKTDWIIIEEYCRFHNISPEFINLLQEEGLIEPQTHNSIRYIPEEQLANLERFVHLHHDLEVNVPGIGIIHRMLQKMEQMEEEMGKMRNKISHLMLHNHIKTP